VCVCVCACVCVKLTWTIPMCITSFFLSWLQTGLSLYKHPLVYIYLTRMTPNFDIRLYIIIWNMMIWIQINNLAQCCTYTYMLSSLCTFVLSLFRLLSLFSFSLLSLCLSFSLSMYTCAWTFILIYMYICICIEYIRKYIIHVSKCCRYMYFWMYICIYIHTYIFINRYRHIYTCECVCIHVSIYIHMYIYVCTHIHIYMYIY